MFSVRTAWPREANRLTLAEEAARRRAGNIVDLTVSNPTAVGLPYATDTILAALATPEALHYAPAPFGPPEAREAIAQYYARRGISVRAEDVLITATTSEAYTYLFRLLVNPGESVAIPRPSYPLFNFLADLADVDLEPYHLRYLADAKGACRWRLDEASLREALEEVTQAIITVSPNNPTGSCLGAEDKQALIHLAATRGLAIISDEVFLDYLADPKHLAQGTFIGTEPALTFALSGLSKVAGLPQMKVSWIVLSGPPELRDEARARLEIIADTFLSVSTPAVRALPTLLGLAEDFQSALRARLAENTATLAELTRGARVVPRRTDGGWYAMVDLPEAQEDEAWAVDLLERGSVLVHPGYLFDVEEPSAVVLSTLVPPEVFREGVKRLVSAVESGCGTEPK